jgi:hypothetical protein
MRRTIRTHPHFAALETFAELRIQGEETVETTRTTLARHLDVVEGRLLQICADYNSAAEGSYCFRPAPTVAGVPFIAVERRGGHKAPRQF